VDRLACVDLPALPLQLLLQQHPAWASLPVVVVDEDRPQGTILWGNEQAREQRICPGQRFAEGLSLARDLRAGVVTPGQITETVEQITDRLRRFSPGVEPASDEAGTFWLDASGLERLFGSLESWASALGRDLTRGGFRSSIVVGFSRFGSYALARQGRSPSMVCASPAQERRLARQVPLHRLGIEPSLQEALHRLGIHEVGALVRLPAEGLLERFGPTAHRLHTLAAGRRFSPLVPRPETPAAEERVDLDYAEEETTRLLFLVKGALHRVLSVLAQRGEALVALHLWLTRVGQPARESVLRPAEPTLDSMQLIDLIRLRLESLDQRAGVTTFRLRAQGRPAPRDQLQLFLQQPRRDLAAANRALARVRAELGQRSVLRAVLQERHLPEARFTLEPLHSLETPRPPLQRPRPRPLVRRFLTRPRPLSPTTVAALRGGGTVAGLWGPHVISGGWWGDPSAEIHRAYHFVRLGEGDLLWIYFDRRRGRWLVQGHVE
jgi:protein ImuB